MRPGKPKSTAAAAAAHVGGGHRTIRNITRRIHDDRATAAIPVPRVVEAVVVAHAAVEIDAAAAAVIVVGFTAGAHGEQDGEAKQSEIFDLHFVSSGAAGMLTIPIAPPSGSARIATCSRSGSSCRYSTRAPNAVASFTAASVSA